MMQMVFAGNEPASPADFIAEATPRIEAKVRKEIAAPAHKARRADMVQDIIEKHAGALWKTRGKAFLKGNEYRTAAEIRQLVRSDLQKLKKIPCKWALADESDPASVKKEIGRITKRITNWMNANCPTED